jgi:hypothetical protein
LACISKKIELLIPVTGGFMRIVPISFSFRSLFVMIAIVLVGLGAQKSAAQTQGRITGRVTDSSGAVIVGARVTIENTGKGVKRILETNSSGDYVAPGLEPGLYSISVEAPNFKKTVRERVQIEVANDLKIDFELTPGAAGEVLEVKDEAPLVDATTSTLNGVLSNKAINELPLQGRDFLNLLALHPGVQRDPGGGFHTVTSNGLRPDDNNFIIDGATDNDAYWGETVVNDAGISGTPASTLPLDAIQEFNTQEQPQADFGEKPGVVVNVGLKSGTDKIHGTAYYFHRNAALDARNYFDHTLDIYTGKTADYAALLLHQFGASIGGPIVKGKWFYFANYEGVRSKVGNPYNAFSPVTEHLPEGFDFDDPARLSIADALTATGCDVTPELCNPLSMSLLKYIPTNPGFTADPIDPTLINFNFNNVNRADNLVFKSDFHPNERNAFTGRFVYANAQQIEEDAVPLRKEWLSTADPITQVFGADWTWTPNSRWVNVARFSYNQFSERIAPVDQNVNPTDYGLNTGITDPRLFGFPRIGMSTYCCEYFGGNSSWPTETSPSHAESFSDTVSYTAGRHAIRFGGDFSNGGVDYFRAGYGRGRVDFRLLTNFLLGEVRSWRLLYGDSARDLSMKSFGLFVQDDFRATRRLTLNLGLRYDVTYPVKDTRNRLANFDATQGVVQVGYGISEPYKTNYNNISPRIGMAWDLFGTGRTILRSGFGLIFSQPAIRTFVYNGGGLNLNPTSLIAENPNGTINSFLQTNGDPEDINWSLEGPIFPVNDDSLNVCSAASTCTFSAVDQKLKTPYVMNWNVNLQHEIRPGTLLQVAYVANRGRNLYSTTDPNQVDPNLDINGGEQSGRPMTASCPDPVGQGIGNAPCFPYIAFLNFLGNKSSSSYQSLQTTLTHRYSNGLYLLAGYTWGHAIDTAGNTNNLGYVPQNSFDYAAEKGNGDYDIQHRFTVSATYDLPSRKSWGQLLEGWQVTSIVQWQTGYPLLIYDNSNDFSLTGEGSLNASTERWNIKGDPLNLKWSAKAAIPFLANTFDEEDNVIRDLICTSVANTEELLEALDYAGGCYAQNGTILYAPAFGTFGNMGRNIARGPGFANWDASVGKTWKLGESMRVQFRGEVFNLTNHSNFAPGSIGGELASPDSFGRAGATPDVQAANPVVGSGGSRHIQLGVKLIW